MPVFRVYKSIDVIIDYRVKIDVLIQEARQQLDVQKAKDDVLRNKRLSLVSKHQNTIGINIQAFN